MDYISRSSLELNKGLNSSNWVHGLTEPFSLCIISLMTAEARSDRVPLNTNQFFLLLVLNREPLHGYEIKKRSEKITKGKIKFSASSLYESIYRLQERCLIEELKREVVVGKGRNRLKVRGPMIRIIYEITDEGRNILQQDMALRADSLRYYQETTESELGTN